MKVRRFDLEIKLADAILNNVLAKSAYEMRWRGWDAKPFDGKDYDRFLFHDAELQGQWVKYNLRFGVLPMATVRRPIGECDHIIVFTGWGEGWAPDCLIDRYLKKLEYNVGLMKDIHSDDPPKEID